MQSPIKFIQILFSNTQGSINNPRAAVKCAFTKSKSLATGALILVQASTKTIKRGNKDPLLATNLIGKLYPQGPNRRYSKVRRRKSKPEIHIG